MHLTEFGNILTDITKFYQLKHESKNNLRIIKNIPNLLDTLQKILCVKKLFLLSCFN